MRSSFKDSGSTMQRSIRDEIKQLQASNQLVAEVGRMIELMDTGRERRKWAEETVRTLQCQVTPESLTRTLTLTSKRTQTLVAGESCSQAKPGEPKELRDEVP